MRVGGLAAAGWVLLIATLMVKSLRNFSGMLIHDLLCHRDHWAYQLCHENPTVLSFWDHWRGFKESEPSYLVSWLREASAARSPLNAIPAEPAESVLLDSR